MSIGQLITMGISGTALSEDEKKFIIANDIGGIILFGRNIKDPQQTFELCSEIHALTKILPSKAPILISIDQEGGRVARLKNGFTIWPPAAMLGKMDSPNTSFQMAQAMGTELLATGFHLDFAPCADVYSNPQNTVIGDRAISNDPDMVAKHISALIRGFIKAGIIPCAKHFPGHGHTIIDSHEDLPIEAADLARLESFELIPFKKAIRSKIDFIMTSHILFKNIDPEWPVTLSEFFLKKLLRENLQFKGLIISDDLDMKAMTKKYPKDFIPIRALYAGVDILLYCNEPESVAIACESVKRVMSSSYGASSSVFIEPAVIQDKIKRVIDFKKNYFSQWKSCDWEHAKSQIASKENASLAETIKNGMPTAKMES